MLTLLAIMFAPAQPISPPMKIADLANTAELREKLGVPIVVGQNETALANLKVAVLDYGFEGFDPKRNVLPATTEIIEHYDKEWVKQNNLGDPEFQKGLEPGNPHGRQMAQACWTMAGGKTAGPKFYLLNANGPTLFKRAVKYAVEQKVNVILFSGHFEGGGNYDGKGSINAAVTEAMKAGIIWVNAAGNHHGRVYSGAMQSSPEGNVRFGTAGTTTALFFTNRLDENTITITLTWNDYQETEDAGTMKDLDLFIDDASCKTIAKSELKQIAGDRKAGDGESRNPRERLTIPNLAKGTYRIRAIDKSRNFEKNDRLRILLMPSRSEPYPHPDTNKLMNPVVFNEATNAEELFPPADHPRVITVGESSTESAAGPTADRRLKPDVILPAIPAKWSNGEVAGGTSYAAAYFAGIVVHQLAIDANTSTNEWMRWFAILRKQSSPTTVGKPEPARWKMPSANDWDKLKKSK